MKRLFDVVSSSLGLVVLSPLFLLAGIAVRVMLGSPVIFQQRRPGLNETIFTLYKFRTMRDLKDPNGDPLPDNERLTRFGKFLRSTSIDELPELLNVLKGEMSLVGPRPLLPEYLALYDSRQRRRHEVRPGITGFAQVKGRNARSWPERLECDVWYVENQSFALDLRILAATVSTVVRGQGVTELGQATVRRFPGND